MISGEFSGVVWVTIKQLSETSFSLYSSLITSIKRTQRILTNQKKNHDAISTNQGRIKTNRDLAYMYFYRAFYRLHVFPRSDCVTCFPSLFTGLTVFLRSEPVVCFHSLVFLYFPAQSQKHFFMNSSCFSFFMQ